MAIDPEAQKQMDKEEQEWKRKLSEMGGQVGQATSAMSSLRNATQAVGTAIAGPLGGALASLAVDLPGMMKDAVMGVKAVFDQVVSTVKPFVQAFAPNTVMAFDVAMRDTTAVIGYALVPAMQTCTQIVRAFGDAILPTMLALEPAIREVSTTIMHFLQPVITNLGGIFRGLADGAMGLLDLLRPTLPLFQGLMDALRVSSAIFQGVIAQWATGIGMMLKDLLGVQNNFASLGDAFRKLAVNALFAAVALAKLVGADAFVKQIKRALGEGQQKGASTGMAAAQNAQITDVASWSKSLAMAAVTAQGTGGESKEEVFNAALLAAIGEIDTMDLKTEINKKLDEVATRIVNRLEELPADIAAKLAALVPNPKSLRPPAEVIRDRVRQAWG